MESNELETSVVDKNKLYVYNGVQDNHYIFQDNNGRKYGLMKSNDVIFKNEKGTSLYNSLDAHTPGSKYTIINNENNDPISFDPEFTPLSGGKSRSNKRKSRRSRKPKRKTRRGR